MKISTIQKAKFISVWDDGTEIETNCMIDLYDKCVFNIEKIDIDGLNCCMEEYIILLEDGRKYQAFPEDEYRNLPKETQKKCVYYT